MAYPAAVEFNTHAAAVQFDTQNPVGTPNPTAPHMNSPDPTRAGRRAATVIRLFAVPPDVFEAAAESFVNHCQTWADAQPTHAVPA